jgi:hypothetical protein
MFKTKSTTAAVCLATTLLAGSAAGDDTDIYFVPSTNFAPTDVRNWPAVMISYDIRPSSGANTCQVDVTFDFEGTDNSSTIWDDRIEFISSDATCQSLTPQFLNDLTVSGLNPDRSADWTMPNHKIYRYELYAIVLQKAIADVLDEVQGEDDPDGRYIQIGLMMPHDNTKNDPGCSAANEPCSQGGFISLGLGPSQDDIDTLARAASPTPLPGEDSCADTDLTATQSGICATAASQAFFAHLNEYTRQSKAIATTQRIGDATPSLNADHTYNSSETYFELYRYLRGGQVFRGKMGRRDFATTETSNMYLLNNAGASTNIKSVVYDPDHIAKFGEDGKLGWDWSILATSGTSVAKPPAVPTDAAANAWAANYTDAAVAEDYLSPAGQLQCSGVNVINFVLQNASYVDPDRNDSAFNDGVAGDPECTDSSDCGIGYTVQHTGRTSVVEQMYRELFGFDLLPDDATSPGTQGITSYIVSNNQPSTTLNNLALAGSGNTAGAYHASSPEQLAKDLGDILTRILSESATFLAPAVPASSVNRTQTLNEVFLALFQVQDDTFWPGNVKKLRIGEATNGDLIVAGVPDGFRADGVTPDFQPAFDLTGRIAPGTLTYGTIAGSLSSTFEPTESTLTTDGREVPRGGAGQRQPAPVSRVIYTEGDGGAGDLVLLAGKVGQPGYPDSDLYDWMIGDRTGWVVGDMLHSRPVAINYGARGSGAGAYTTTNPDIRIVVGSNDGFLRMIRNTFPGDHSETDLAFNNTAAVQSMEEVWAFVPKELFGNIARLRNDNTLATPDPAPPPSHPNGFDGPITLIRSDTNGDDKITAGDGSGDFVWAIGGLRRGGKHIYAFDLTDPDANPPRLMWKIGHDGSASVSELDFTGASNPSDAFAELGQTWSEPVVGIMELKATSLPNGHCATDTCVEPVLVFGGGWNGYPENAAGNNCSLMGDGTFDDTNSNGTRESGEDFFTHDDDAPNRGCLTNSLDDPQGNAVYIVHAESGQLIWKLVDKPVSDSATTTLGGGWNGQGRDTAGRALKHPDLDDSVPATVSAVDMDGNGLLDRIYFGDTGGVLWRVNLADSRDSDANCEADPDAAGCPGVDGSYDDTDPEHWRAFQLLSIGRNCSVGGCVDRRFLSQADVVSSFDDIDQDGTNSPFDGVIIGTGDRENPLSLSSDDVFYFYKDAFVDNRARPILRTDPASTTALPAGDDNLDTVTFSESEGLITRSASFSGNLENGWRVPMPHTGEKVVGRPLTIGGVTFFTTFEPKGTNINPCIPSAGTGRLWALNVADASAALDLSDPGDGSLDPYATLDTPGIPPPVIALGTGRATQDIYATGRKNPIVNTGFSIRAPTYWRREEN